MPNKNPVGLIHHLAIGISLPNVMVRSFAEDSMHLNFLFLDLGADGCLISGSMPTSFKGVVAFDLMTGESKQPEGRELGLAEVRGVVHRGGVGLWVGSRLKAGDGGDMAVRRLRVPGDDRGQSRPDDSSERDPKNNGEKDYSHTQHNIKWHKTVVFKV